MVRIVLYVVGLAVVLAALRMVGCSPGQVAARAMAPQSPRECAAEHRVYAAGTSNAIRVGLAACEAAVARAPTFMGSTGVDCVLRAVADVKNDAGLRMLVEQCRPPAEQDSAGAISASAPTTADKAGPDPDTVVWDPAPATVQSRD